MAEPNDPKPAAKTISELLDDIQTQLGFALDTMTEPK